MPEERKPFTLCPVDGSACGLGATINSLFSNVLNPENTDPSDPAFELISDPTVRIRVAELLGQLAEKKSKDCKEGAKVEYATEEPGSFRSVFCQLPDIEMLDDIAAAFGFHISAAHETPVTII